MTCRYHAGDAIRRQPPRGNANSVGSFIGHQLPHESRVNIAPRRCPAAAPSCPAVVNRAGRAALISFTRQARHGAGPKYGHLEKYMMQEAEREGVITRPIAKNTAPLIERACRNARIVKFK